MSIFDRYIGQDGIYRRSIQRSDCTRKGGDGFLPLKRYVEGTYGAQWLPQRLWIARQLAPVGVTSWKKVTKGNKVLASGALSGASEGIELIARGAFIYQPKRVIGADFEVVRDTGFEPVTPTVSV